MFNGPIPYTAILCSHNGRLQWAVAVVGRIYLALSATFYPITDLQSPIGRWESWKQRFETYIAALNLTEGKQKSADKQKRAVLLYQVGQDTKRFSSDEQATGIESV